MSVQRKTHALPVVQTLGYTTFDTNAASCCYIRKVALAAAFKHVTFDILRSRKSDGSCSSSRATCCFDTGLARLISRSISRPLAGLDPAKPLAEPFYSKRKHEFRQSHARNAQCYPFGCVTKSLNDKGIIFECQ